MLLKRTRRTDNFKFVRNRNFEVGGYTHENCNHYGSARKGNTLTAINAFIKGASEKNEIEIIEPDKLNIAPCKGCGVCQCSKGCVDKDDTNSTIDKIAAADMILFVLLVY